MILLADYEKKLVIPRWLNHAKAVKTRELSSPTVSRFILSEFTKKQLAADYLEFKDSPTPHKAADLMGAAFVIGNESIAKEVAQYVKYSTVLQKPVLDLANHILGETLKTESATDVYARIAQSKKFLAEYPNNALGWIERARCYTIVGQAEKAEYCVRIALKLAPSDRFIVRSAVRFFLHSDKLDQAWDCVKHASAIRFDPWIKATEISIAEAIKKSVKKLKGFVPVGATPDKIYHFSELIESYGMLELINGNDKRAKKHFKIAWANPSHNVVTHSEWIVREHFPAMAEMAEGKFGESIEATAWQNYYRLKVDDALRAANEWALEEPYAKNAFSLGSSLAYQKHNYDQGVKIAKEGLKVTPNEFGLQNNLCFGLLKMNKVPEAEIELLKIIAPTDPRPHVVFSATKGLLEFKKGNINQGRSLYLEAIGEAEELGDRRLLANACMNLAITEIESNTAEAREYTNAALKLSERLDDASVVLTRQLLEERLTDLNKKKEPLPFKDFHGPKILPRP
jgi:tetratricopeptide (TPR) repeat protein